MTREERIQYYADRVARGLSVFEDVIVYNEEERVYMTCIGCNASPGASNPNKKLPPGWVKYRIVNDTTETPANSWGCIVHCPACFTRWGTGCIYGIEGEHANVAISAVSRKAKARRAN